MEPRKRLGTRVMEAAGALLLAIGFVGIFLPILPTTPFVLAAAFCFSANPKMYAKIRDSPYFGEYLRAYKEGVMVWVVMAVSVVLLDTAWLRALLLIVGAVVTVHLLTVGRARGG